MKEIFFGLVLLGLFIVLIAIGITLHNKTENPLQDDEPRRQKYEDCLGEKHVLDGDTLTIVNYSIWHKTLTLSNGVGVRENLIFNDIH